jgi:hypothetical protein
LERLAAAAAQAPEQVAVFGLARLNEVALGADQVGGKEVVDRQPVLSMKPADSAAERQAGDTGVADEAAGGGEPERLGLAVELAPEDACLDARPRVSGSTRIPFIGPRSMTMPPSQTE